MTTATTTEQTIDDALNTVLEAIFDARALLLQAGATPMSEGP